MCWKYNTAICLNIYSRGHQRGTRGRQVTRKAQVGRPRA